MKRIISALLIASVALISACGDSGSGLSAKTVAELKSSTAATSEDLTVNGAVAAYFFNDVYTSYTTAMASLLEAKGFDADKPLSEQRFSDEMSFLEYFTSGAKLYLHHYMTLCESAEYNGISLTPAEIGVLKDRAERGVKGKYGENLDYEDIFEAVKLEALANKFESIKTAELMPSEEEMYKYASENIKDYKFPEDDTVNVRHILFSIDTYGSKEAALEKANEVLEGFGVYTENTFALLALEYSDDPSTCYVGGLYKNLANGRSKEAFNKWCFDEARFDGELTVIETEFGAHIVYFEGKGLPKWQADVSETMVSSEFEAICELLYVKYPVEFNDETISKIAK